MPQRSPRQTSPILRVLEDLDDLEVLHTRIPAEQRFPVHFHSTYVIQLIIGGADQCTESGLTARTGEIFLHWPQAPHCGGPADQEDLEYLAFYPSPSLVEDLAGPSQLAPPTSGSAVVSAPSIARAASNAFHTALEPRNQKLVRTAMSDLFRSAFKLAADSARSEGEKNHDAAALARDHLVQNYEQDVSIGDLSDLTGLSPFHLIRRFKSAFGITPRQFLISHRVAQAKELIGDGMSLVDVACVAGFSDQSHLHRCFKRVTGVSPGRFQASYLQAQ